MSESRGRSGLILGLIAIIVSLVVLVVMIIILKHVEFAGLDGDYVSLLIGALALIATVLIGFQITSIIQLDKRFETFADQTKQDIETALNAHIQLTKKAAQMAEYDAVGTALMMLSWTFQEKGEIDDALRTLINSLRALQYGDTNNSIIQDHIHEVEDSLIHIAKTNKRKWQFKNIDEKNVFIDTVMKIRDKSKMNILLNFFYRFGIAEQNEDLTKNETV